MSWPSISILPDVGLSKAPIRLSSVDLPLPLRPTIETNFPSGTSRLTSLTATTVVSPDLNCRLMCLTFNILFYPHDFCRSYFGDKKRGDRTANNRNDYGGA